MPSDIVYELVEEANRIGSMLHNMPHFNLGAHLKDVVGGMAINEDVKIQHGEINIYVQFNVTMDTADIANTMAYNNKEHKPYFKISDERSDNHLERVSQMDARGWQNSDIF